MRRRHIHAESAQPCWSCQRATGFCPWSFAGKPIKGWNAIPTIIKAHSDEKPVHTYDIKSCPLYVKDVPKTVAEDAATLTLKQQLRLCDNNKSLRIRDIAKAIKTSPRRVSSLPVESLSLMLGFPVREERQGVRRKLYRAEERENDKKRS